jgi:hypothetical protein
LRQQGYTVGKTIDCLIATFGLQAKHELLHRTTISIVSRSELG